MIVIDVECYKNYFLLAALHIASGKVKHFELTQESNTLKGLSQMMNAKTTVSFNGNGYDLAMISAALKGYDNAKLKRLSDKIIKSNLPTWRICKDVGLKIPNWDHIDLIEVAPGTASLKIYGARLNAPKLQDLPISPDETISEGQRELLRRYCVNDLATTALLLNALKKEIDLREKMSKQYGVDLRSKGGAQVAKSVLAVLLEKEGVNVPRGKIECEKTIRYKDPGFFRFESETLKGVFNAVLNCEFEVGDNGHVRLPKSISKAVDFRGASYKFGIGGLHSQENKQAVVAKEGEYLFEKDVASMYPNIILGQNLYPKHLGGAFCKVYRGVVDRRLKAKKEGDKSTSDSLKLIINSSFGLFGSKYSFLYSPDLLIQTTITGQLALLMLIERVTSAGAIVVSANTDGVVVKCSDEKTYKRVQSVCFDWELDTALMLEETPYKAIYSQSVNNYVAVCNDGTTKRKGCFAKGGLSKNPAMVVCYDAVSEYLSKGVDIAKYIYECKDPSRFLTARQVKGGAVWRDKDLGKAVRFYYSKHIMDDAIRYRTNGNKVPKSEGSTPLMDMGDTIPDDLDYSRYINEARTILKSVGC